MNSSSRLLADRPHVCVVWDDAHGIGAGEYTAEEIIRDLHRASKITTFGLLIQDDERGVTLASEITSEDTPSTYRGLSFIPRGMITEVIVLGVPKRPLVRKPRMTTPEKATP